VRARRIDDDELAIVESRCIVRIDDRHVPSGLDSPRALDRDSNRDLARARDPSREIEAMLETGVRGHEPFAHIAAIDDRAPGFDRRPMRSIRAPPDRFEGQRQRCAPRLDRDRARGTDAGGENALDDETIATPLEVGGSFCDGWPPHGLGRDATGLNSIVSVPAVP